MADVTGTIGSEHVELNNAATEATLRLILAGIQGSSKASADAISKFAKQSGLDPAAVAAASSGLKNVSTAATPTAGIFKTIATAGTDAATQIRKLDASISPLIGQLLDGTAKASSAFKAFEQLPGIIGIVATGFRRVAEYQEDNMKAYQQISAAGASFGGSLTDLRQSALNTYMTLDQFSSLIKNNSEAFSNMGGTVNDGAKAFVQLSKAMISGDAGSKLLALGFTTEQLNNGMANYIAATGGRNKKQMEDTDGLTKGAKAYFEQLDALATITGVQREEQEKAMKEAAANAAYQNHLSTLSVEERAKTEAARAEALARGGKGAEQALMSAAMGLPPMTKAAQQYTALAPTANAATMKLVGSIKDTTKSVKDIQTEGASITAGLAKDGRDNAEVYKAMGMANMEGSETTNKALAAATKAKNQDIKNESDARAQLAQVQEEQRKRQTDSQANAMGKAEKAMKEIGQVINDILAPAIGVMTSWLSKLVQGVAVVFKAFGDLGIGGKLLVAGIAALVLWKTKELVLEQARALTGKGNDALSKVKGMVPGSTPANPLFVTIVGGGGGSGLEDLLDKDKKNKKPVPKNRAERLAKVAEGRAAQAAKGSGGALKGMMGAGGGVLKGAGVAGGIASALMLAGDLSDIEAQKKAGAISEKEATTAKGGAYGEAGGGLAGGLAGAAAGAALGSVVPILGTAIGGLIGGAIGAWGGGSLGKSAGESLAGGSEKTPPKKMADGGIVTSPTNIIAGDAGPEGIIPMKHFETLQTEMQTLNKQTEEVLKYLKEIADHSSQGVSATKSLMGDLFKF